MFLCSSISSHQVSCLGQALQLAKRSWLLYLMAGLNAASIWTTQITQTSSHAHVIGASVDTCKSAKLFSALFRENARCTNMSSFKIYHLLPHCQCFLCTFGGTGGKDMGSSTLGMGGGFGKWAGHFLPACAGLCFVEVGIAFCLIMASLPKNKRAAKSRV